MAWLASGPPDIPDDCRWKKFVPQDLEPGDIIEELQYLWMATVCRPEVRRINYEEFPLLVLPRLSTMTNTMALRALNTEGVELILLFEPVARARLAK